MKSWYKYLKKISFIRTASVTFSIEDSWRISQPKNLLYLCSDFINFIYYKEKLSKDNFKPDYTDIEPDTSSSDFEGYTGIINFYIRPEYDINEYINAINVWIQDKSIEGYKINYKKDPEQSNSRRFKVFRISIQENPSEHYEKIPELNLSNGNAMAILRLLGLSSGGEDYSGKIDLNDLRKRIESVSKDQMQQETTPSGYLSDHADMDLSNGTIDMDEADRWKGEAIQDDPPPSNKVKIWQSGRDENYIDSRLQSLYEIVYYGLKNNFKYLVWG